MSVTFIAAARRFKSPKRRARRCARVAVDGTGLSHNAASTFLIRRMEQRPRGMTRWSYWLKWLVVTDLDNLVILAQHGRQAPWCDCRSLPDLVDAACEASPIGLVLADAEFDTEQDHRHIRTGRSAQHHPGQAGPQRWHWPFVPQGKSFAPQGKQECPCYQEHTAVALFGARVDSFVH